MDENKELVFVKIQKINFFWGGGGSGGEVGGGGGGLGGRGRVGGGRVNVNEELKFL